MSGLIPAALIFSPAAAHTELLNISIDSGHLLWLAMMCLTLAGVHIDAGASPLCRPKLPSNHRVFLPVVLTFLIAVLVVLLTGGASSPLFGIFIIPVLLAAARFSGAAGILVAILASLYGLILMLPGPGLSNRMTLVAISGNIAILNLVAGIVAVLFRRIGLNTKRLELEASQASALDDLSRMMESTYDLETTLNLVVIVLRMLFTTAASFAIYLVDARGKYLELRASSGVNEDAIRGLTIPMDEEEHGWAPVDGIPLLVCDTRGQPHARLSRIFPNAGSFFWVPLRSVEGIIGLIAVAAPLPDQFSDQELRVAETLAGRVAFPIQRARLRHDLELMAFTDGLTGLYNHRYFHEQLRIELEKAKRYGHPVSLIMFDLDHFKKVNDAHGHRAGDRILAQLGALLKRDMRHADILARYGGEEFAVICPETSIESALHLAERLRKTVESEQFSLPDGPTVSLTVSGGVASFPENGETPEALIESADKALYLAKHADGNQVSSA